MTTNGRDWLTARAREGYLPPGAYTLGEMYAGERADLVHELRTALIGCDEPEKDRLGRAMLTALSLDALPVLRAVVAVWRDAYLHLLDRSVAPSMETMPLDADEWLRLHALKQRIAARGVVGE